MKRVWISIGIFGIMLVWVGFCNIQLKNLAASVTSDLSLSETAAVNGNYDDAGDYLKKAYGEWNDADMFLGSITKHSELDQIFIDFEQADAYLDNGAYQDFMASLHAVRLRIMHIQKMESLDIGNIF